MSSFLTRLASGTRATSTTSAQARAPKAATGNVYYSTPGQPQVPRWDGLAAISNGYEQCIYVMRCARATAEKLAAMPWRAGADPDKTTDFNPAAPLARLLGPAKPGSPGGPNPQWSARSLWIWSIVQRIVTGRMAWEPVNFTGTDRVGALWPLVAPFVQPIPSPDGSNRYFDGYAYMLPTGRVDYTGPDSLFYSYRPSQLNPREPESVLQAAALPVSLSIALERYLWALAKNGMVGRTLVVTPPFELDDDRRAFQEQFEAEFTGYDNGGKTLFGEVDDEEGGGVGGHYGSAGALQRQSVQVLKLDTSPTDAQVLELSREMRQVIREALGTPQSVLGDATASTYANAAQDKLNWMYDRVMPLGHEVEDDVNLRLAPRVGSDAGWFDFEPELQALEKQASAGSTNRTTIPVTGLQPADPAALPEQRPAIDMGGMSEAAEALARAADRLAGVRADKPAGPAAAGLAVKALDTGRVLMLQRALTTNDPAAGTWEFPGGCLDEGEDPLAGAIREWMEEVGAALPSGRVAASWTSPNGVYRGFVYLVPGEDDVAVNLDHEDRHVLNPDDPDGDEIEVVAWWNPATLPGMTALRPECRTTPWELLATAGETEALRAAGVRYDVTPLGEGKNWVTDAGGLPLFIRAIAHALIRDGHSESQAIQIAVGRVKDWAAGRGNVTAKTRAKAAAALAEWEAKKAKARATPDKRDAEMTTEGGSAGLLLPRGTGGRGHVFAPSGENRRRCAVCGKGVTAAGHVGTGRPASRKGRGLRAVDDALTSAGVRHPGPDHHHVPSGHLGRLRNATRKQVYGHADTLEPQLAQVMRGLFTRQRKATIDRLNGRRGQRMLTRAFDAEEPRDGHGRWSHLGAAVHAIDEATKHNVNDALSSHPPAATKTREQADKFTAEKLTPKLSAEQRSALERYTGDSFYQLNHDLRAGRADSPEVRRIDSTMRPADHSFRVTRQVNPDAFGLTDKTLGDVTKYEGTVIRDPAYMSTTIGPELPHFGGVTMHLLVPKGTPAVSMRALSLNPHESEVLLGRGLRLAVARVVRNDKYGWDVYATVVPGGAADRRAAPSVATGERARLTVRQRQLDAAFIIVAKSHRAADDTTGPPEPTGSERPVVIDASMVFDLAHWLAETRAALNPVYAATTALTVARMDQDLRVAQTLGAPSGPQAAVDAARAALDARGSKLADTVTRTTYDQIAATIAEGVAQGEHVRQIADRVGQVFDDADQTRAETIARTEVIGSLNTAADAYAKALPGGLVLGKEWLATPDDRTRPDHREAAGQRRDMGEPFMVGGYAMQHPGDINAPASEVVNCRCTTLYVPARAVGVLPKATVAVA